MISSVFLSSLPSFRGKHTIVVVLLAPHKHNHKLMRQSGVCVHVGIGECVDSDSTVFLVCASVPVCVYVLFCLFFIIQLKGLGSIYGHHRSRWWSPRMLSPIIDSHE